jgi:hypothetical protein
MVALWMAKSNIIYDLISVLDLTPLVWFCFVSFLFFSFPFLLKRKAISTGNA